MKLKMLKINRFRNVFILFMVTIWLISCKSPINTYQEPLSRRLPNGFYVCNIHLSSPIYLAISGDQATLVDLYSIPGDTIVTVFDYEQINNNIIQLLNDEYYSINVSEIISDQYCDSIEVYPILEKVTKTKGWLSITFNEVNGPIISNYNMYYNPIDPNSSSFKIPRFSTDTPKEVGAKFIPSSFSSFTPDKELYYGTINYFADPLWEILNRSNPVFTPTDELERLNILIGLSEYDFARPHFLRRLATIKWQKDDNAIICIDDMQFYPAELSYVEERNLKYIINKHSQNSLDE